MRIDVFDEEFLVEEINDFLNFIRPAFPIKSKFIKLNNEYNLEIERQLINTTVLDATEKRYIYYILRLSKKDLVIEDLTIHYPVVYFSQFKYVINAKFKNFKPALSICFISSKYIDKNNSFYQIESNKSIKDYYEYVITKDLTTKNTDFSYSINTIKNNDFSKEEEVIECLYLYSKLNKPNTNYHGLHNIKQVLKDRFDYYGLKELVSVKTEVSTNPNDLYKCIIQRFVNTLFENGDIPHPQIIEGLFFYYIDMKYKT